MNRREILVSRGGRGREREEDRCVCYCGRRGLDIFYIGLRTMVERDFAIWRRRNDSW